ncbi:MAG: hypothetical protein ACI9MJ_002646 [Alphaproteobacteria bacterium]|jgi:hypothetical protein
MKNFIALVLVAAVAGTAATYFRYQSFNPCMWLEQEYAEDSALPLLVTKGRIKAEFFLRGIREPTVTDCTVAWWNFRLGHPNKPAPEKKS